MVGKLLEELSVSELKTALGNTGIKGICGEALCVVRLTVHLVNVGEDPYSFRFNLGNEIEVFEEEEHLPEEDVEDTVNTKSGSGPSHYAGISVSGLADDLSARCSVETVSDPLSTFVASSCVLVSSSILCLSSKVSSVISRIKMHAALVTDAKTTRMVDDGLVLHHREYGGTLEDTVEDITHRDQSCSPGHL